LAFVLLYEEKRIRKAYIVEELNETNIAWQVSEMLLQKKIDSSFKHESIIDGDIADSFL
jgi:hypothetical protein